MKSEVRLEVLAWTAQRLTALVLAACVVVHLVTIVLAVRGGLSGLEILARTRGSLVWLLFYGGFAVAVAVHAAIGLRAVVREMTPWRGRSLDGAMAVLAIALAALGLRAALGLYA